MSLRALGSGSQPPTPWTCTDTTQVSGITSSKEPTLLAAPLISSSSSKNHSLLGQVTFLLGFWRQLGTLS